MNLDKQVVLRDQLFRALGSGVILKTSMTMEDRRFYGQLATT